MAYTNQIIRNLRLGNSIKFLNTAEDTKGEFLRYEALLKVGAFPPPEHSHPKQTETFTILEGEVIFKLDGKDIMGKSGDTFTIPTNVRHTFKQTGSKDVLMQVEFRPALRTEFLLETFYALGNSGKIGKTGFHKKFFNLAAFMYEFRGHQVISGMPVFKQKLMANVIGGFAKIIGFKGYTPYKE